jgi:cytoskeletal protein CcmA (bactofilin family)
MRKYTPKDALPLPPALAGKGLFTRLLVPDDGDKRKAAIYGVALEAAANALEWLRHRLVNGLEGGAYDGPLSFTNLQTIGSHNPEIHVTSGLDVDSDVHVGGKLDVDGDAHVGGKLDVDGDAHVGGKLDVDGDVSGSGVVFQNGIFQNQTVTQTLTTKNLAQGTGGTITGVNLQDATRRTRTGSVTRSGPNGWDAAEGNRVVTGPNADTTIDGKVQDVVKVPTLTATRTWTLGSPDGLVHRLTVVRKIVSSLPHNLFLVSNGVVIATLHQGTNTRGAVILESDGAEYFVVGQSGNVTTP